MFFFAQPGVNGSDGQELSRLCHDVVIEGSTSQFV